MPVGINFSKAKAERFVDCLRNGKPIDPTGRAWTVDDMMALAGACYFGVMSHGPMRLSGRDWGEIPEEHREAAEVHFLADLAAAVRFSGDLTMRVRDGEYDGAFEPECSALVSTSDGEMSVTPLKGFREE